MEKGGKRKTNKDEKRGLHPNMQPSVISSWLNSQTHEVEVLGTLHSQMLCVLDDKQEASERQRKKTEWFGLVLKKEGNGKQQTKLGFKSISSVH